MLLIIILSFAFVTFDVSRAILSWSLSQYGFPSLLSHLLRSFCSCLCCAVFFYNVKTSAFMVAASQEWVSWLKFFNFDLSTATSGLCVAPLSAYQQLALSLFSPVILLGELGVLLAMAYSRGGASISLKPISSDACLRSYLSSHGTFMRELPFHSSFSLTLK